MNRIGNFVAVALIGALAACGAANQSANTFTDAATAGIAARPRTAITTPISVKVVSVKGSLVAMSTGKTPRDLVAGMTVATRSLTATGSGAIVDLGTGA